MLALMDHRHPRVTRVTRVTSESVENRGSVKIREGSAKSTVKLILIITPGVNNKYQQSYIYIYIIIYIIYIYIYICIYIYIYIYKHIYI